MNHLIEEQEQLRELEPVFSQIGNQSAIVAVDTEFLREKTYNARLCLVQLGINSKQYLVDVLSIEDLQSLADLLADESVLKLFHAARQDIEVIIQTLGVIPKPIFDTQLAAAFCGLDMQIGYSALVEKRLGVKLPKSQARTDWTRRPLTKAQIEYAGEDVAHLGALYQQARQELEQGDKLNWYDEELESYYDEDKYIVDPAKAYLRVFGGGLRTAQQYTLKALAEWREATAQERDIPRNWVMRDDRMFELASRRPKRTEDIMKMGVFGRKSARHLAPQAARVIAGVEVGQEPIWNKVEPFSKEDKNACNGMMRLLSSVAKEHNIAQGLLGTRRDIESLYRHRESDKLLSGWRAEVIGKRLMEFLGES